MVGHSRTYLDWAAAAPVSKNAQAAFVHALTHHGNPSSPHMEGRAARDILDSSRRTIARLLSVKEDAVVFTAGATEANALAIVGRVKALHDAGRAYDTMHALFLPSAHASVVGAMETIAALGVAVEELSITDDRLDLTRLRAQVVPATVLVSLDVVCGETGTRYDIRDARRVLDAYTKETKQEITLHADASQAAYVELLELSHLGADLLSLDAQKVGGVRGIGALIAPRRTALTPLIAGGGQERGLRPGTESPALAAAFATALTDAQSHREQFLVHSRALRTLLLERLSIVPHMTLNEGKEQAPHILNLSLIGRDTDYLVALLDERGFAVSTKSACETGRKGSRAVFAMTGDNARAASTLRISWGPETKKEDLIRFADAFITSVRFLDEHAI